MVRALEQTKRMASYTFSWYNLWYDVTTWCQCKVALCCHSLITRNSNIMWQYDESNVQSLSLSLTMLCIERSCGNPGVPDNGEKNSSSYKYDNVVSFSCNVGYNMQGSQVRTCQTNGEWTGTQPTCLSKLESVFCSQVRPFTNVFPLRRVYPS